jgi:hypothetical protein
MSGHCRRAVLGIFAGALAAATMAAPALAQSASSPVVGTWIVAVTVEGPPPLTLPNLVTFATDGTMTVAAPPRLPELPAEPEAYFSGGQGAWTASGQNGAKVVFAFVVSGPDGAFESINTVRGSLEVDPANKVYIGQFMLTIADKQGATIGASKGTWRAKRVETGDTGPVTMP